MNVSEFSSRFQGLLKTQPRYNVKQVMTENCDYADTAIKSKNCYYSFCTFYCEDVYYSRYSRKCVDCSGVTFCVNCEKCLECSDCATCYDASFSRCCRDSSFLEYCEDCTGCEDCFGCIGLCRRRFCLFNEQLSEMEYRAWLKAIDRSDAHSRIRAKLAELKRETPLPALHHFRTENCTGDYLSECRNCSFCFDAFKLEDCCYNVECNGNRDCCDLTVCFEAELCYSCVQAPLNYNCNFLVHADSCAESEFCAFSKNLKHCFGCVYLADKEFCLLNEQLDPETYNRATGCLRRELAATGRYDLSLYFAGAYEQKRLRSETDAVITALL